MTIGTLFTLFVVPSVYVLIAKDHRGEGRRDLADEPEARAPTASLTDRIGLGAGVAARTVES